MRGNVLRFVRMAALAFAISACASARESTPELTPPSAESIPPDSSAEEAPSATPPAVESVTASRPQTWQVTNSQCDDHYFGEQPPIVRSIRNFGRVREICFDYYVAFHSGATRGPLWSAVHLTRTMAEGGDCITRIRQRFLVAPRVSRGDRASDTDYENNRRGFQRGHLTPANDMPDARSQRQTFNLSNAVPQAGDLNEDAWGDLEASLHVLAEQHGDLYIVTGPIFEREIAPPLNGRVAVPSHIFKAVFDPHADSAIAFVAANDNAAVIEQVSLAALEQEHGIVPFPALATSIRDNASAWTLPSPAHPRCIGDRP